MSNQTLYDIELENKFNRERQSAFAAHTFCSRCQGAEEVTLPGETARLISNHIETLEREIHTLRNGYGRHGA